MKFNHPLVSIVIVNFNGLEWLKGSLLSIKNQKYTNYEVIIVDNNSTDESVPYIKKHYPNYIIIENNTNLGFAEGNNIGIAVAKGTYYFLLNNDTVLVDKNLISKTIKFMNKNTQIGALQPKICLLNNPDKIDLCGSFWTPTTMLYHYGCFQSENDPLFMNNFPVFTCKGAAMFVRKNVVDKVGLFDSDFWCYYEETDFCHRVWLAGYECWYFAEAKILHANGGTSLSFNKDFIQFHNFKNKLRSFIKNFSGVQRVLIISKFTVTAIIFVFISLFLWKPKNIRAIFSAFAWNIKKLLKNDSKHITLTGDIPEKVTKNPGLLYYIDLVRDLKKHNYNNDI